jgi:hypothetical protein
MRTRLILKPGQDGTKQLVKKYGSRLVCIRYRYNAEKGKRYKTVELIIDETDWQPEPKPDELVGIRVAYSELELRQKMKDAGGRWNPVRRLWELHFQEVVRLGLVERMVREEDGLYVVEGVDGNFYTVDELDDGFGWSIGDYRWDGMDGWQKVER